MDASSQWQNTLLALEEQEMQQKETLYGSIETYKEVRSFLGRCARLPTTDRTEMHADLSEAIVRISKLVYQQQQQNSPSPEEIDQIPFAPRPGAAEIITEIIAVYIAHWRLRAHFRNEHKTCHIPNKKISIAEVLKRTQQLTTSAKNYQLECASLFGESPPFCACKRSLSEHGADTKCECASCWCEKHIPVFSIETLETIKRVLQNNTYPIAFDVVGEDYDVEDTAPEVLVDEAPQDSLFEDDVLPCLPASVLDCDNDDDDDNKPESPIVLVLDADVAQSAETTDRSKEPPRAIRVDLSSLVENPVTRRVAFDTTEKARQIPRGTGDTRAGAGIIIEELTEEEEEEAGEETTTEEQAEEERQQQSDDEEEEKEEEEEQDQDQDQDDDDRNKSSDTQTETTVNLETASEDITVVIECTDEESPSGGSSEIVAMEISPPKELLSDEVATSLCQELAEMYERGELATTLEPDEDEKLMIQTLYEQSSSETPHSRCAIDEDDENFWDQFSQSAFPSSNNKGEGGVVLASAPCDNIVDLPESTAAECQTGPEKMIPSPSVINHPRPMVHRKRLIPCRAKNLPLTDNQRVAWESLPDDWASQDQSTEQKTYDRLRGSSLSAIRPKGAVNFDSLL